LLVKRPSSLRPEGYSRYGKGGITPLLTGTFSISNCAWDAGVPLLAGAVSVVLDSGEEMAVAVAASECGAGALGLQATREKLRNARTIAVEYCDTGVSCKMKSAEF
jgi:hypothetical protein